MSLTLCSDVARVFAFGKFCIDCWNWYAVNASGVTADGSVTSQNCYCCGGDERNGCLLLETCTLVNWAPDLSYSAGLSWAAFRCPLLSSPAEGSSCSHHHCRATRPQSQQNPCLLHRIRRRIASQTTGTAGGGNTHFSLASLYPNGVTTKRRGAKEPVGANTYIMP